MKDEEEEELDDEDAGSSFEKIVNPVGNKIERHREKEINEREKEISSSLPGSLGKKMFA